MASARTARLLLCVRLLWDTGGGAAQCGLQSLRLVNSHVPGKVLRHAGQAVALARCARHGRHCTWARPGCTEANMFATCPGIYTGLHCKERSLYRRRVQQWLRHYCIESLPLDPKPPPARVSALLCICHSSMQLCRLRPSLFLEYQSFVTGVPKEGFTGVPCLHMHSVVDQGTLGGRSHYSAFHAASLPYEMRFALNVVLRESF